MVLDTVLGERSLQWLGAERDKVEYFRMVTSLRLKELPHLAFGAGPDKTIRYFPDKLPIGITGDGRTHAFLYLVNRKAPVDFRAFLHRHSELLRALPEWELRLLVPRHLLEAAPLFEQAALMSWAGRFGWTMWPSFAGISGNKTKSITVVRPRTSGGFAAPVARLGRRGFTCSIGSGRRMATGPWTPQCRRCLRTRSRAEGAMSRAKCCLISMPIFHPWLARRRSEIPRTEGTTGSGGVVPLLGPYVQGLTRLSQHTPWQDTRFTLDRAASRLLATVH